MAALPPLGAAAATKPVRWRYYQLPTYFCYDCYGLRRATVFTLILLTFAPPHSLLPAAFLPPPLTKPELTPTLLPMEHRLAQIVEMIQVVSLLHDDVINTSALSRGIPFAPAAFGNKLAQHHPLAPWQHRGR
ncbi:hypothetical protein K438DRAFT_1964943 [Mycena galopus ATCC 62051]|nr:hypothetical protein K438DRAFT_1964943 [Mycena galopus ATCC 62051]